MKNKVIRKELRLTVHEKQKLKDLSLSTGLSESDVIRSLIDGASLKELPKKDFYDAINKINKIGVNINQLTKVANITNNIYSNQLNEEFNKINEFIDDLKEKYL